MQPRERHRVADIHIERRDTSVADGTADEDDNINFPIDFDLIDAMIEPPERKLTKGQIKVVRQRLHITKRRRNKPQIDRM